MVTVPSAALGTAGLMVADQAMVHPTEVWGNATQPIRPQEMFFDHDGGTVLVCGVSGLTQPRMFRPRSNSWRAVVAISSCNVLPVTMEISPTNAGSCARQ